jgi:hypothetical protein
VQLDLKVLLVLLDMRGQMVKPVWLDPQGRRVVSALKVKQGLSVLQVKPGLLERLVLLEAMVVKVRLAKLDLLAQQVKQVPLAQQAKLVQTEKVVQTVKPDL